MAAMKPRTGWPVSKMESSTKSAQTFGKIKTRIQNCEHQHESCRQWPSKIGVAPALPERLIELQSDVKCTRARLMRTCGLDQGCRYATLSHCWGRVPPIKLRRDTLESYQTEIPWAILSKTFREAFEDTRELDISHLWIDSICIIQDDDLD